MDFERRLADMDWRLVDAFDLQHIDTVLLQEMVPSVTYGLVTEAMCASPRLACKLICILQLLLEMFIGCRKHDAYDVQLLQDDLSSALRDRDGYRLRLKEALTDTKALKVQLARTTTLLKSCGHVLHAHGCSPHAIAALEALLATPLTANADATVKVAHLCAFCGKAFGTQDYLLKHLERRHPGGTVDAASPEEEEPTVMYAKPTTTRSKPSLPDYQAILSKLETMLSQHEVSIRAVAADETAKLQAMQTEMHLESGIKTELHVARAAVNARLDDAQRHLAHILEERDDAMKQLLELKDEIALLKQKQAMQPAPPRVDVVVPDVKDRLTIERLQAIVEHSKDALAIARDDLKTTHDKYADLLVAHERTKFELAAVEKDLMHARQPPTPVPTASVMCQTNSAADTKDAAAQTAPPPEPQRIEVPIVPEQVHVLPAMAAPAVQATPAAVEVAHTGVQTDAVLIDAPFEPQAVPEAARVEVVSEPVVSEPTPRPSVRLPPELVAVHIEDVLAQVLARAERPDAKPATLARNHELARRPFLKSVWPHSAAAVESRIKEHLATLDQTCERYGVSRLATKLSHSQHALATTALKAHLHAMPVAVLQKMVAIDTTAEALVTSEWIPNEASRQTALAAIKTRMDEQDATQTHWVMRILEKKTSPDAPPATTTTLTKVLRRPPPVDMATTDKSDAVHAPPTTHMLVDAIDASSLPTERHHESTVVTLESAHIHDEDVPVSAVSQEPKSVTSTASAISLDPAPTLILSRVSPHEVEASASAMPEPRAATPAHPGLDTAETTEAPPAEAPKAGHVISVGRKAAPREEERDETRSGVHTPPPIIAALGISRDEAPVTDAPRTNDDETTDIASRAAPRSNEDTVITTPFISDTTPTEGVFGNDSDDLEALHELNQDADVEDEDGNDDSEDRNTLQDVDRSPTEDTPAQRPKEVKASSSPPSLQQDGGGTYRYAVASVDDMPDDDDIQELDISDSMVSTQPRTSVLSGDISGDEDEPVIPTIDEDTPLVEEHHDDDDASPIEAAKDADSEDEVTPAPDRGDVSMTSVDDPQTGSGHDETPTTPIVETSTFQASSVLSSIESIPDDSVVESSVLDASVLESSVLDDSVADASVESFIASSPAVLRGRDMDDDTYARPKTAPRMSLRDSLLQTKQSAPPRSTSFSRPSINRWGRDDDDDDTLPDATPLQSLRHNATMDDDLEEEELA
ncbi:hypothetical protein SDRG_04245 [Saprolegnia diclina VS20]|uniref:C2H2-type domain-containing protein n=1 Tax=Saprolegnia diclina (strain VS20) TaxID=1156394 RepID=T0QKK3_SAPDV|nr:hypothetical protein SDRG_04245 [Saprolegnia diclina VS20]EQC38539.1 hypothetical protein SDRG_04245 [Saprolegnia diclina VS20]|eukprot:XP_008608131.1 hypothetical protein SDRG_04245 [Saprolegnia diclina VS20]